MAGTFEPSYRAIDAAAVTEANEVNIAMGGEAKPWRMFAEDSKEHWRRHVGAAVRAAYAVDFPSKDDAPIPHVKVVVGYRELRTVVDLAALTDDRSPEEHEALGRCLLMLDAIEGAGP